MADEWQLKILTEQGVKAWNKWRKENPIIGKALSDPRLGDTNLSWEAVHPLNLGKADLRGMDLRGANFSMANLFESDLSSADLYGADFSTAGLFGTNLSGAMLIGAKFNGAGIFRVDFSNADLRGAKFDYANVEETNFDNCSMSLTQFLDINLSQCKGLETVKHFGPSAIDIATIYRSKGDIPETFLHGAGIPEPFIVQVKSLVAAMSPIEFYSCFISYSSKDQEFAERLYADLQSRGVRCWFAPEDLKIGDKLRLAFDEAIRVHDKLMVLLSKNSVGSPWVEKEVETAFEKERREKRTMLFPIRLDEAVMNTDQAWAADIRRTRHIGDFRDWKNHDSYKKAFDRLLRDLKAV